MPEIGQRRDKVSIVYSNRAIKLNPSLGCIWSDFLYCNNSSKKSHSEQAPHASSIVISAFIACKRHELGILEELCFEFSCCEIVHHVRFTLGDTNLHRSFYIWPRLLANCAHSRRIRGLLCVTLSSVLAWRLNRAPC